MNGIAEFVVKVADLVEAEGRSARSALREEAREFREASARFAVSLVLVMAGALLSLGGLSLCMWALHMALEQAMGEPGATLVTGLIALVAGAGCLWIFRKVVSEWTK